MYYGESFKKNRERPESFSEFLYKLRTLLELRTYSRAVVAILKLVGPGPYPPKKSGGARAQPAHTPTPALLTGYVIYHC